MYRDYERVKALEEILDKINIQIASCIDEDKLVDLHIYMEEVKERINFAYQDEEESYAE